MIFGIFNCYKDDIFDCLDLLTFKLYAVMMQTLIFRMGYNIYKKNVHKHMEY